MKIVFITHNYPLYESERSNAGIFVADLVKNMIKKRVSIEVFILNADVTRTVKKYNGRLIEHFIGKGSVKKSLSKIKVYNPLDLLGLLYLFITNYRELYASLNQKEIDFILAFWAIPSGIIADNLAKRLKIPFGIWALGSDIYVYQKYPIVNTIINRAISNAKILFADGVNLARIVSDFSGKSCQFLPSSTVFPPLANRKSLRESKNVVFAYLGRMERLKGPDIFLKSLTYLPKNSNFHAFFLGGGDLLEELKKKSHEYGLQQKVKFLGMIFDVKIIQAYLCMANYLVIPSRSDSIPLVIHEAAKCGTPVVTSSVGDMPELVKKYQIGYSFPSQNEKELSMLLRTLIKRGKNNKKYFSSNLKKFSDLFDLDIIATKLLKEIESTLG